MLDTIHHLDASCARLRNRLLHLRNIKKHLQLEQKCNHTQNDIKDCTKKYEDTLDRFIQLNLLYLKKRSHLSI